MSLMERCGEGKEFQAEVFIDPKDVVKYKRIKIVIDLAPKTDVKNILKVLKPSERKVLEVIHEKEEVTQAELYRILNFSYSKLWRLLKDLEERNMVSKEEYGKTYKVKLAGWLKG